MARLFEKYFPRSSPAVGSSVQYVTRPWLAKLYKSAGCDFVPVEYEHGCLHEDQLSDFVLACRSEGLPREARDERGEALATLKERSLRFKFVASSAELYSFRVQ